jgi:hypothetical protein
MLLAVGVAATLAAGTVCAQQAMSAPDNGAMNPNPPMDVNATGSNGMTANQATAAGSMGIDTSVVTPEDASPAQIHALAQGDNTVVTNGPVPDTPANRALYRPLSHAGRISPPKGN